MSAEPVVPWRVLLRRDWERGVTGVQWRRGRVEHSDAAEAADNDAGPAAAAAADTELLLLLELAGESTIKISSHLLLETYLIINYCTHYSIW